MSFRQSQQTTSCSAHSPPEVTWQLKEVDLFDESVEIGPLPVNDFNTAAENGEVGSSALLHGAQQLYGMKGGLRADVHCPATISFVSASRSLNRNSRINENFWRLHQCFRLTANKQLQTLTWISGSLQIRPGQTRWMRQRYRCPLSWRSVTRCSWCIWILGGWHRALHRQTRQRGGRMAIVVQGLRRRRGDRGGP